MKQRAGSRERRDKLRSLPPGLPGAPLRALGISREMISFFDSLIESTSAIADAMFGKTFTFCWQNQTCPLTAILSAHPIVTGPEGTWR